MDFMLGRNKFPTDAPAFSGERGIAARVIESYSRQEGPGTAVPFGLANSNRAPRDHTTKNRFASSYPMAVAAFMEDRGIAPVVVRVTPPGSPSPIEEAEIPFSDLFGLGAPLKECRFDFERSAEEHEPLCRARPTLDVIVTNPAAAGTSPKIMLELKVSVTPDETTAALKERDWRPELVFRPVTLQIAAMNLFLAMGDDDRRKLVGEAMRHGYGTKDWKPSQKVLTDFVDWVLGRHHGLQRPLVLNLVWATIGKSSMPHPRRADVFVWTDLAYVDVVRKQVGGAEKDVGRRCLRAVERFCCALIELCATGQYSYNAMIHTDAATAQTDKEISLSGKVMRRVIKHPRATQRLLTEEMMASVLPDGYARHIEPERRIDVTLKIQQMLLDCEGHAMDLWTEHMTAKGKG